MKANAIMALAAAATLCGSVYAQEAAPQAESEAADEEDFPISASFSVAVDSKYLSYGFVDNKDPIVTPSAELTVFDFFTLGVEAIFDTTTYGRNHGGYGNRAGKYTELHPYAGISYALSPDDYEWLPTTIELGLDYLYEYHPTVKGKHGDRDTANSEDSQFWTISVGLPDLWIEPVFTYERDVMRDNGTYLNLELGHTFELTDSVTLRPSIAQGYGNKARVAAYACYYDEDADEDIGYHRYALMDTVAKLELTWSVCDNLELSGYVAYSDFVFDSHMREAARYYASPSVHNSYNFFGGVAATLSF